MSNDYGRWGTIISLAVKAYEPIRFNVEREEDEFEKIRDKFIDEKRDAIINSIDEINRESRRLVKNCAALKSAGASLDSESMEVIEKCILDAQRALAILKGEKRGWMDN